MIQPVDKIWVDGKFVDWGDANVHILTHTLHYGLGVFEGIRCYYCEDGRSAVFRLKEHIDRLFYSAHISLIKIPFSREEIVESCKESLRINGLKEGYIRPLVFIGDGAMGLHPQDNPIRVAIIAWAWGAYLGDEGLEDGIRAKISSFTKSQVNTNMSKAKICGNYTNSIMAKREVTLGGYDEAVLLDTEGYVSEASGENIFIVKNKAIKTTPLTSILQGITRDAVIKVATDKGWVVLEEKFTRDELYSADEVFLTGTAAEITPIREIDDRMIGEGKPGPFVKDIQKTFFEIVKGKDIKYQEWLSFI